MRVHSASYIGSITYVLGPSLTQVFDVIPGPKPLSNIWWNCSVKHLKRIICDYFFGLQVSTKYILHIDIKINSNVFFFLNDRGIIKTSLEIVIKNKVVITVKGNVLFASIRNTGESSV